MPTFKPVTRLAKQAMQAAAAQVPIAPHGCGCACGKCNVARPFCPYYVAANPAMRVAKRLAPLFGCTPRQLLLAMYYVPRWVPQPIAQFYLWHVAQRFYPAGYLCQ